MDDKLKIGIFGDSQANYNPGLLNEKSWVDVLQNYGYDLINYAEPGSSLYFSYNSFIESHEKFDKVIFLTTDFSRLLLPKHSGLIVKKNFKKVYHAKSNIREYVLSIFPENKPVLDAIEKYYAYIYNEGKEKTFKDLLLTEMKRIRPDGLYYNFWEWMTNENHFYNIDSNLVVDARNCHLTETNNKNMARYIIDWINNKNSDMKSYYSDPIEPYERYFK